jgi:hypothetical protein
MQQNTDGDGRAAEPEGADPGSIEKDFGVNHLPLSTPFISLRHNSMK